MFLYTIIFDNLMLIFQVHRLNVVDFTKSKNVMLSAANVTFLPQLGMIFGDTGVQRMEEEF